MVTHGDSIGKMDWLVLWYSMCGVYVCVYVWGSLNCLTGILGDCD